MRLFVIHLLLSFYLCSLAIDHIHFVPETAGGTIIAFLAIFISLWLTSYLWHRKYFRRISRLLTLSAFFVKEFIHSNIKLTKEILTPGFELTPAVVKVPLTIRSDGAITALANITNLTPGTLIVGISEDKRYLYVHTLYLDGGSREAFKAIIKNGFESRIIAVIEAQ
ncbi:Na+/H+ antiporter subunit E [Olivibacter sp. SDN3]|uniref:Na+/H+ antiporter subunit E n=1 Tax=Olivibacter sp. SDN3 TaxID=2764720 RepID=UPI0016511D54|nr:Na+/H+ antiporter subunit E [Olivibacter sp. SDN3]QNL49087.1 Na+/H+ antiporter subunit E [Olivibacter sp. SDN3]